MVASTPGAVGYVSPSAELEGVRRLSVVLPPRLLSSVGPLYPQAARRARVSGKVSVRLTIDERGRVDAVDVVSGLPHGLTEAAVSAVRTWRCAPATCDARAIAAVLDYQVDFCL